MDPRGRPPVRRPTRPTDDRSADRDRHSPPYARIRTLGIEQGSVTNAGRRNFNPMLSLGRSPTPPIFHYNAETAGGHKSNHRVIEPNRLIALNIGILRRHHKGASCRRPPRWANAAGLPMKSAALP